MARQSRSKNSPPEDENRPPQDAGGTDLVLIEQAAIPALQGGHAVNQALVDEAVVAINRLSAAKDLEKYRAIGDYIVEHLFAGDPVNLQYRDAHLSYRALAAREDLHVSAGTIWNAVQILGQLRELPENIGESLSFAQHRALLTVKDPEKKAALAQATLDEGLTEKQLKERVRKAKPPSGAGRKPDPQFVTTFKAFTASVSSVRDVAVTKESFQHVTREKTRAYLDEARRNVTTMQAYIDEIEAILAGIDRETT